MVPEGLLLGLTILLCAAAVDLHVLTHRVSMLWMHPGAASALRGASPIAQTQE